MCNDLLKIVSKLYLLKTIITNVNGVNDGFILWHICPEPENLPLLGNDCVIRNNRSVGSGVFHAVCSEAT
jgi:hypothetical protein